jgi:hypothetical protein
MSKYIAQLNYTFTPSTRTVDFRSQIGFDARYLLAISNLTSNQIIYTAGISGFGFSSIDATGRILTLQYNTQLMSSTDILQFHYDDQQDALSDISAMMTGTADPDRSVNGLGAWVKEPTIQELLRRLIVEVRVGTIVTAHGLGISEIDVDAMVSGMYTDMTI